MVLSNVFEYFVKKVKEEIHKNKQTEFNLILGCDINAQDNLGQTAAHYSAMHNHLDALKYLVDIKHIDLSLSNNESKLPIHYAAKHGSKNVLNFFFQSNLMIYARDNHGNTITHEASEYNQLNCIKLIWNMNRSLFKLKNHFGRTPLHTV
jgi:ankyrin repeat protein